MSRAWDSTGSGQLLDVFESLIVVDLVVPFQSELDSRICGSVVLFHSEDFAPMGEETLLSK